MTTFSVTTGAPRTRGRGCGLARTTSNAAAALTVLAFAACAWCASCAPPRPAPGPTPHPPAPAPTPTPSPSPPPEGAHSGALPEEPRGSITFIENDYARALKLARARHVPLLVDAWAPWCHTCLSMRAYVFPDPSLQRFASRFVWLSLDTEREENAPVVSRLGVRVLPTLYVLDPAQEKPVLAFAGSLTARELSPLLDEAELAAERRDPGGAAMAALLAGRSATAAGNNDDAIAAYRTALSVAPAAWPRRPEAIDGLVGSLSESKSGPALATCVTTAADEAPKMPPGTALADVLRAAMDCMSDLPKTAPERARLPALATLGERVAMDLSQPILADDRSDLYGYVQAALGDLGKKEEARRVSVAWASFLEDQAAHAPTPAARVVFDAHRLLAYVALGEPQRAVPMLEQSERDFPEDYNAPARLAAAYLKMKRYGDAQTAVGRALALAYGPRKLRLWSMQADIEEANGDRAAARGSLQEALDYAGRVPLPAGYRPLRDALQQRLDRMR